MQMIARRYWELVEQVYNSEPSECKKYSYGVVHDVSDELYWFKKDVTQAFDGRS